MKTDILKITLVVVVFFLFDSSLFSQKLAVKTNIPYFATATPNMALELGLTEKFTLNMSYGINPFTFEENRKWNHWLVQSEFRYWSCERFYGHFIGFHVGVSEYNLSRIKIPTVTDSQNFRYEGWAAMGGISYGYSWVLGERWNLEATLGLGMVYTDYKKYYCAECGTFIENDNKMFFAPTKAAISIIYMLK